MSGDQVGQFSPLFSCLLPLIEEEVENTVLDFLSLKSLGWIELKEADFCIAFQTNPGNLGIDEFCFLKRFLGSSG